MNILAWYNLHAVRAAALLGGLCVLSIFIYGALLLGAVAHAAERAEAERQVKALSSKLGSLESGYLARTKSLSLATAAQMGLVQPASVTTVALEQVALSLAPAGQ